MAGQYIFTMLHMTKSYGARTVLKDISLCFFPGAKIGVVGDNGSGKSTLLKIMAGLDKQIEGEAWPDKGVRVGLVAQEPHLQMDRSVRENVELAFADIKAMLAEFDQVTAAMGEPQADEEMDRLMNRMSPSFMTRSTRVGGWELDRKSNVARRRARPAAGRPDGRTLSGGERAARRAVPRPARTAGHPAARRADQPPGRRDGRVARRTIKKLSRHRDHRHADRSFWITSRSGSWNWRTDAACV